MRESKVDGNVSEIEALKEAEKQAEEIVENAKREYERKIAEAQRKAHEIIGSAKEEAVVLKNDFLKKAEKDIESEIAAIMKDAKEQAESIRLRRIDEKRLETIVMELLGSYNV
ncbi:MAG: hypothetical protein QXP42_03485 [Candidatus Micrarchaeia archaeon]